MSYDPYGRKWVLVYCPVCGKELGLKPQNEMKHFDCLSEGCSRTRHYFYPGKVDKPDKSEPWAMDREKRTVCDCASCQASREGGNEDYFQY